MIDRTAFSYLIVFPSQDEDLDFFSILAFHLAKNTLERVPPLTHVVGNVLKLVFMIGYSILVFGKLTYT